MKLLLAVFLCSAVAIAQAPDADQLQLQIRAQSEQIAALRFQLDTCSGEVAQVRYQKALQALVDEVQAKHPNETVTLGPQGWMFTPKEPAK